MHATFSAPFLIFLYSSAAFLDFGRFFSFLTLYTLGKTPWTEDQPVATPLPTHTKTQTE
jgi:hypothetical protein